jgi:hypothetical protein
MTANLDRDTNSRHRHANGGLTNDVEMSSGMADTPPIACRGFGT